MKGPRMLKDKGNSTKPVVNVVAIGHVDHGKTTLAAAMALVLSKSGLAKPVPYGKIDAAYGPNGSTVSSFSQIEYESDGRRYIHVDCPAHADYVKGLITGPSRLDAALVVISAADGPMPQTREHLLLARRLGVERVIVFLNKADMVADPKILALVESEVRELLAESEYDSAKTPIVKGSALKALRCGCGGPQCPNCAVVFELLKALDDFIPNPVDDAVKPLLLRADDLTPLPDGGLVVAGDLLRGRVRSGQRVALLCGGQAEAAEVMMVEPASANAGNGLGRVKLVLKGASALKAATGCVVAEPGSISAHKRFRAEVILFGSDEGGLASALASGASAAFDFWGAKVAGRVDLSPDHAEVVPGDHASVLVTLESPAAMEEGLRFALRDGGRSVGTGAITEIVE